jgi:hypothetical protein
MAEVLGVVASGIAIIQLATGIVSGAQKLRRQWCEVRDAPRDIAGTLEEIEILGQSLIVIQSGLDRHGPESASMAVMEKSLELCQKASTNLDAIVSKFAFGPEKSSASRRMTKLKVLLQRDEINEAREQLQRAIRYLNLAANCYSMSVLDGFL